MCAYILNQSHSVTCFPVHRCPGLRAATSAADLSGCEVWGLGALEQLLHCCFFIFICCDSHWLSSTSLMSPVLIGCHSFIKFHPIFTSARWFLWGPIGFHQCSLVFINALRSSFHSTDNTLHCIYMYFWIGLRWISWTPGVECLPTCDGLGRPVVGRGNLWRAVAGESCPLNNDICRLPGSQAALLEAWSTAAWLESLDVVGQVSSHAWRSERSTDFL